MSEFADTITPLMIALVHRPGLDSSGEDISAEAAKLIGLMNDVSAKVIQALTPDTPELVASVNKALANLVSETWKVMSDEPDPELTEKIAQIFIGVIDNIELDLEQPFDQTSVSVGIDVATWISKCLPPIIELKEMDPDKKGKGKLLLSPKSYEDNILFIQNKIADVVEDLGDKMMVKDSETDKSLGLAVSDLYSQILKTQYHLLLEQIRTIKTTDEQQSFLTETKKYPDGMLIETSFTHLESILDVCFPGSKKDGSKED